VWGVGVNTFVLYKAVGERMKQLVVPDHWLPLREMRGLFELSESVLVAAS
jgi:hypothetical protein